MIAANFHSKVRLRYPAAGAAVSRMAQHLEGAGLRRRSFGETGGDLSALRALVFGSVPNRSARTVTTARTTYAEVQEVGPGDDFPSTEPAGDQFALMDVELIEILTDEAARSLYENYL